MSVRVRSHSVCYDWVRMEPTIYFSFCEMKDCCCGIQHPFLSARSESRTLPCKAMHSQLALPSHSLLGPLLLYLWIIESVIVKTSRCLLPMQAINETIRMEFNSI